MISLEPKSAAQVAGGFGVVYLAEQRQLIRRGVVLKLIKLGMDTTRVMARVKAERQAFAGIQESLLKEH